MIYIRDPLGIKNAKLNSIENDFVWIQILD